MRFVCWWFVGLLIITQMGCDKPSIGKLDSASRIVAFGDSLTYGYGVPRDNSYPSVLENLLGCEVINAGVSGEDTTAGLRRLPQVLSTHSPDLVILCFGGNDMLRKQPREQTVSNLKAMIEAIIMSGADLILIGVPQPEIMLSIPEYFEELANHNRIPYEGEVLVDVLSNRGLKSDHIHPNKEGYAMIAKRVADIIRSAER